MENKTVVRCSNDEQKRQVIKYARKGENLYSPCKDHECVNVEDGCHQTSEYYISTGYKIISFEDFEKEYLGKTPKIEFIPGKWYKLSTGANSLSTDVEYINYIKYIKHSDRLFHSSEYINIKGSGDMKLRQNGSFSDMLSIESIDLSEIQQYLPENHPDKIVSNEVDQKDLQNGNTYVSINQEKTQWDSIFTSTGGLGLKDRVYLNNSLFVKGDQGIWAVDLYPMKFRKATEEEIQWQKVCIKADKFIPKEEALKPKEMELIEGKWYRLILNSGSINWLFKYIKGSYRTSCSKYINLDDNIKGINNHIDSDSNIVSIKPANMEEVYEHFPEERPKEEKVMRKVEELKYPDVIHIESKEQWEKLYSHCKNITDFKDIYTYYLIGGGISELKASYPKEKYNVYEFSDIVFPEEVKYKSWSIQYTPKFTEDIFNKLIDWCRSVFRDTFRLYSYTKNTYEDFKSNRYFWVYPNKANSATCGVDNNAQGYPLISLNELISIIGYSKKEKPMEKEENWIPKVGEWVVFLPDKAEKLGYSSSTWNKPYILKIDSTRPGSLEFSKETMIKAGYSGATMTCSNDSRCFRKALPEEIPSEVPEYVECIKQYTGQFTAGKVYRTAEDSTKDHYRFEKDDKNSANGWSSTCFKPSTKEAYDKQQNTPKMEENDDWCVECTKENGEAIAKWGDKYFAGWNGNSVNSYYGLEKGRVCCRSYVFGKLLSTEEFYKKIGHKVEKPRKFSLGKIRFKGLKGGDLISEWDTNGPNIKHGDIVLHKDYDREGAEIVGFYKDFYEIRYKGYTGNYPVLGFTEDQLEEFSPMSKENSLLEEAKRRYPIGTSVVIHSIIGSPYKDIIKKQSHSLHKTGIDEYGNIWFEGNEYGLQIYCKRKDMWAEIVSEGKKYPVTPDNAYKEVSQAQAIIESPIKIQAEVTTLRIPVTSASVTLKNTEREVKINIKQVKSVQLN